MRTLLKLILLLIVLVVGALIALPFFVNPNDYKQEIADKVEEATGRTLTLEGDIELSVFPWIALELGPLSLSNAEGFKADSFAKVETAEIRIKLMPLLKKQLEMDTVVLDGLVLNLETKKSGQTNWDDLAGSKAEPATTKEPSSAPAEAKADTAPALAAVSIAGVQLTNANILWDDVKQGQTIKLKNVNLTTDPLVPGEPTALDAVFDIESSAPQAEANVGLSTKVMVDLEQQLYALTGLSFTTKASSQELPFETTEIKLTGDVNADMVKQLVTIDGLDFTAKAKNATQTIDAQLNGEVSSNLGNQQSAINGLALTANIVDPALPNGKAAIKLSADVKADMQQQTAAISGLLIEALDLLIKGDVTASKLLSEKPQFAGKLNIDAFNLRQLAKQMAIELPVMADDSTLSTVAVNTQFAGSTDSFNAKSLKVTLDQSTLTGNLGVANFAKPVINFKLNLDEIDADRYLPPVPEGEQKAAPPAAAAAAGATELPLEPLRQLNAKGSIDIGKLKISNIRTEKIHVTLKAADGLVKLSPMSANLYQGTYKGNVTLDARGKALKLALDENISGVQAGPLLKDMNGDDPISGTANASAKLTGAGANVDQIKSTLTGSGKFSFKNGAVKGINIGESIRKAKAALKGKKVTDSGAPSQTDFSSLTGSFTAKNGLISNKDLAVMSPLLRVNGAGTANLPTEAINYNVKVAIVETSKGQGGKELDDLKGLKIPVKITGTFQEPKPKVDLANLFKQKTKDEAKKKIKEKLDKKLGGKLGDLLGGSSDEKSDEKVDPAKLLKGFF